MFLKFEAAVVDRYDEGVRAPGKNKMWSIVDKR